MGCARHEDWHVEFAGKHCQPIYMVSMLVSDKDGGKSMRIIPPSLHAFESLAAGDSRIHQDGGRGAANDSAISPAARGQHRDGNSHGLRAYSQPQWKWEYFFGCPLPSCARPQENLS